MKRRSVLLPRPSTGQTKAQLRATAEAGCKTKPATSVPRRGGRQSGTAMAPAGHVKLIFGALPSVSRRLPFNT
jgi:hypothetical protein